VVGTFTVADPNTNDTQTLELLNSANGRFSLSGSPATGYSLVVADGTQLDYEAATNHLIRVRSTDQTGLSVEQDFTIYISNIADSSAGNLTLSSPTYSVREDGSSIIAVKVLRVGGVEGNVGATLRLTPGTATYPDDYSAEQIPVLFSDHGPTERLFTIPIVDDSKIEGNETVNLTLTNPTGGAGLTGQVSAVLTIVDNDFPPIPRPTVNALTTNDSTPLISGTAVLQPGQTLSVQVNAQTYTYGATQALQRDGDTWTLQIPDSRALADGTYDVRATVSDANNQSQTDATTGEVKIDTHVPTLTLHPPTSTAAYWPVLTGSTDPGLTVLIEFGGASFQALADGSGLWSLNTKTATPTAGSFNPNRDGGNALLLQTSNTLGSTNSLTANVTIRFPYPDLVLSSINLPGGAGLSIQTLTATVTNAAPQGPAGPGNAIGASAQWLNRYFLSPDRIYADGNDIGLGDYIPPLGRGVRANGPLAAGESRQETQTVQRALRL